MKTKIQFSTVYRISAFYLWFFCAGLLLTGCHTDHTTVVYGTITDINRQPVDSILVVVSGSKVSITEPLKEIFTDKDGKYELTVEVPNKYNGTEVAIPFWPDKNPKFQKYYKGYIVYKDNMETNDCCRAIIGRKTKYDFQLMSR